MLVPLYPPPPPGRLWGRGYFVLGVITELKEKKQERTSSSLELFAPSDSSFVSSELSSDLLGFEPAIARGGDRMANRCFDPFCTLSRFTVFTAFILVGDGDAGDGEDAPAALLDFSGLNNFAGF